jgi:cytochrome c nitrite reductase small subunit
MRLPMIVGLVFLVIAGVVFLYVTQFTAYLGDNPTTCNNCHVMDAAYESWYHASHKNWAVCSECHTPHALIPKYVVKSQSGYHHVTAFMLGNIPDAIRAKPSSLEVVQANCIRCHFDTVENVRFTQSMHPIDEDRFCFECHRSVAHGERGISLLPYQHSEEYDK